MCEATSRPQQRVKLLRETLTAYLQGTRTLRELVGIETPITELRGHQGWADALFCLWGELEIVYANALDRAERDQLQPRGSYSLTERERQILTEAVNEMLPLLDAYEHGEYRVEGEVTLFRAVVPDELAMIRRTDYRAFPSPALGQSVFAPTPHLEYATQVARDWFANDGGAGFGGYVTRFNVRADFVSLYELQSVGGRFHQEYWIPADDLSGLNENIVGLIEIVAEFHGPAREAGV
jgi:hypothetical protein